MPREDLAARFVEDFAAPLRAPARRWAGAVTTLRDRLLRATREPSIGVVPCAHEHVEFDVLLGIFF